MTEAARRQLAKSPRRLSATAVVVWTGLAAGTFLAAEALTHGVMLPWFGGFADAIVTFVLILAACAVFADLGRRHHRTVARHAVRHGKRGASAAYRGTRRHGGRGAAFVAANARSQWASGAARWRARREPEAPAEAGDPPPLSVEWGVTPSPAGQSGNSTEGTPMALNLTGRHSGPGFPDHKFADCSPELCGDERLASARRYASPAGPGRRAAANGTVPGAWGAVVAHTADFQAESDGDLLNWMRGEAMGAAAYAEALVEQYETCLNGIGLDPVAIATLHDVADAATTTAQTMAAAVKRFSEHYELPTQFVADGGLLAHDGRWHKGDDG